MKSISKYSERAARNSFFLVTSILGAFFYFEATGIFDAQAQSNTPLIGPEAVFHPGKDFLKTFHIQERWMSLMSPTRKDGCHACERLGLVLYAFDFDSSGKFLGRNFLKVIPIKTGK